MIKRIRFLIRRPGARGEPDRFYWQPSSELRREGFVNQRVPADHKSITDPVALEAAAMATAMRLNDELAKWRKRQPGTAIAVRPASEHTLADLIRVYERSPDFTKLRPKSRAEYSKYLGTLREWAGDRRVSWFDKPRFVHFYENAYPRAPAAANALMRVARLLFAYGCRHGWRQDNPAEKLRLVAAPFSGLVWPPAAIEAIAAAADAAGRWSIGTAIIVNEWLGQRQHDVLQLPAGLLGQRGLVVRQAKTGAGVRQTPALVPALVERIEAELARQRARHGGEPMWLIVSETTGRRYDEDDFRAWFRWIRSEVARATPRFAVDYIPAGAGDDDQFSVATNDLKFMHLRHTAVVRMASAGCTIPEIASITGHELNSVEQILRHYHVRTGGQADQAFRKRLVAEGQR